MKTAPAGQYQNTLNSNTASLKGKVQSLEVIITKETIRQLNEDLNFNKKEIQILRNEKETTENILTMNGQETRKELTNELYKVEEELKRFNSNQKSENSKIQHSLISLKAEKNALQQQILNLQRRIADLELQIGHEEHN